VEHSAGFLTTMVAGLWGIFREAIMKWHSSGLFALGVILAGFDSGLNADEKLDPTGTWQLNVTRPGRPAMETVLKVNKAGDKLVGVLSDSEGRTTPVKDAQVKDGELTFRTILARDGQEFNFLYKGKLSADAIKGQVTANFLGRPLTFDFEGKRLKGDAAQKIKTTTANVGGNWKLKVPYKDGVVFEPTLKLDQADSGLTGTYVGDQGETAIADGLILGDEFTFEVARTRDGKRFKLKYQGKVQGDALTGSVDFDFDGMTGTLNFDGKRLAGPKPGTEKKP